VAGKEQRHELVAQLGVCQRVDRACTGTAAVVADVEQP